MSRCSISDGEPDDKRIVSKYFIENNVEMDESLADFQETKKKCKGPKESKKGVTKKQPKRTKNKGKGQKDIRIALKPKKDDLLSYATEFRNVCLENGVDVDSEQLQIAIALSKSLNDFEYQPTPSTSKSQLSDELSTQDRSNKIRATLLEYGFSVPEIKKTIEVKKRVRKCIKHSKLLSKSEEEKRQKVADKVSQILFEFSINDADVKIAEKHIFSSRNPKNIFAITGHKYQDLEDDKCFYVGNLVDYSPNTVGCFLKDWSKIPGRPVSPKPIAINEGHFTDYVNCEEHLDVLLTGTTNVVSKLVNALKFNENKQETKGDLTMKYNIVNSTNEFDNTEKSTVQFINKPVEPHTPNKAMVFPIITRNMSPDLFDDEPSINELGIEPPNILSVGLVTETKKIYESTLSVANDDRLSVDATNMKSKNFMNLPDCMSLKTKDCEQSECTNEAIMPASLPTLDPINYLNISPGLFTNQDSSISISKALSITLASSPRKPNDNGKIGYKEKDKNTAQTRSDGSDSHINYCDTVTLVNESGLFDSLTLQHCSVSENNSRKEITDYQDYKIGCESSNLKGQCQQVRKEVNVDSLSSNSSLVEHYNSEVGNVNITETIDPILDIISLDSSSKSIIESDDDDQTLVYGENISLKAEVNEFREIVKDNNSSRIFPKESTNDFLDKNETVEKCVLHDHAINPSNIICRDNSRENCLQIIEQNMSSSQCSPIFVISDEELDYSMQYFKSSNYNLEHGHTSKSEVSTILNDDLIINRGRDFAIADVHRTPSNKFTNDLLQKCIGTPLNRRFSCNDSLPAVEIKGTKVKIKSPKHKIISTNTSTPIEEKKKTNSTEVCNVATPSNSGYIIKTTDVTPMLNYASLDTPERNKELEKYGIKPFKRKRAIQLLEYLYCETHPFVENCDSETPAKKSKPSSPSNSQADSVSPSRGVQTCEETNEDKANENSENSKLYEVTNDVPVLKNVHCDPEDWVFQKREKAKMHSCRVPLHVAFHNYMSARPLLREAVLRYEPISIELMHRQLASDGHRYDPKDLLRFLDKRCITVKTVDTGGRTSNKRSQQKKITSSQRSRH